MESTNDSGGTDPDYGGHRMNDDRIFGETQSAVYVNGNLRYIWRKEECR